MTVAAYPSAETEVQGAASKVLTLLRRYDDSDINDLRRASERYGEARYGLVSANFVAAQCASTRIAIGTVRDGIDATATAPQTTRNTGRARRLATCGQR